MCGQWGVDVQSLEECLNDPLETAEIAAGQDRQPGRFSGKVPAGSRKVDIRDLEQLGVELAMRLVVQADGQQAGYQALAQGALSPAAGVVHPQWSGGRAR